MFCALAVFSTAMAGETGWDGMMRDAGVVVDHQPYNSGGLAADTLYQESEFLPPTWQLVADDVLLSEPAVIRRLVFWGFYHFNSVPTGDETFRVRLYDARPDDGLPGNALYETYLLNPVRNFTGRFIITSGAPGEFRFTSDLQTPMSMNAETSYWLEIVQHGDVESRFRWEVSRSGALNGHAANNPFVGDWTGTGSIESNTAYQLITIPEPSSILLMMTFTAIVFCRRTYRSKSVKGR